MTAVAIAGWFHTLQATHFTTFTQILSSVSPRFPGMSVTLHLLVIPTAGFDTDSTVRMLRSLTPISDVTVVGPSFSLTDESLAPFLGAVIFTPNFFSLQTSLPIVRAAHLSRPGFVLEVALEHPDFSAATRLFHARYSPREFADAPIPPILLDTALEAARRSPSAGNLQAYSLIIVTSRESLDALSEASHQDKFSAAAAAIAFVADRARSAAKYGPRGQDFFAVQDATIACAHLQLALAAVGVQSRWIGAFREEPAGAALGVAGRDVVGFLVAGFGVPRTRRSSRRAQGEYVRAID
jgi:nitroreductase